MRELPEAANGRSRLLRMATAGAAALVAALFALLVFELARRGGSALDFDYLVGSPRDAGRAGGIAPILVGTGALLVLGVALAAPIALLTANFLDAALAAGAGPLRRRAARGLRVSLDLLGGMPSIVFGLFGNALFCRAAGFGYSLLAGGATLACMVLPLMTSAFDAGLRSVPAEERAAAAAAGLSRVATLRHVLLPRAAPLLLAGVVLSAARALAETAALLFTSGYVDRMPTSLLDSARSLSVHVWDLAMNVAGGDPRACSAALLLLLLVVGVHAASRAVLAVVRRSAWQGRRR